MIDINKNYKTREGQYVKIYSLDCGGNYPVHGAVKIAGRWDAATWTNEGWYRRGVSSHLDIIEINEKEEHDMDLYIYEGSAGFAVLNFKPQTAGKPYAIKKITFYEGEGL